MPRRRKRPLKTKYILRRVALTALLLALAGGGVWFAYTRLPFRLVLLPASSVPPSSSEPSKPAPEPESAPVSVSSPEPETRTTFASPEDWELILTNTDLPLPAGYAPPELETVVEPYSVDSRITAAALEMFANAKEEGISLVLVSAYRSEERQREIFESRKQEYLAAGKSEEEAVAATAEYHAIPGCSEHQTGLALDIMTAGYTDMVAGYAETPAAKWLVENAGEFGFILRYPEGKTEVTGIAFEPWHYRYVGEGNARIMNARGFCLEEYIDYLKQANEDGAEPTGASEPADDSEPVTEPE